VENLPASLGIQYGDYIIQVISHQADALTSWPVLFFIDFSALLPWHTVPSEFVESIRALIALADLQLTSSATLS
jgi:hypothetical protein